MSSPKKSTDNNSHTHSFKTTQANARSSGTRQLKLPKPKIWRWERTKHPIRLPNVLRLSQKTIQILWRHRWLFLGIAVVYGLLSVLFVRGLSGNVDVNGLKQQLKGTLGSNNTQVAVGFSVFTSLLASSGNGANATAGAYQIFLTIIVSLAIIWVLRQLSAGERVGIRDAFYMGMYPLVPFIFVLLVVLLQVVPFLIGGTLYSLAVTNGIAVNALEQVLWGLLFLVLAFISMYMLCSSLFALYIVTLPNMRPMKALKSARQLVRYRRAAIFRKILFLPAVLFVVSAAIVIPVIIFAAPAAQIVFFVLSMFALIIVHAYMYTLYRELLEE